MRSLRYCVLMTIAALCCVPASLRAQTTAGEPLATRQNFFTIPFTAPAMSGGRPVEVQLYVSADRGQTWQLYAREHPGAGKFEFRAQEDGEYWFASRTVVAQSPPARQVHRPELRVLIDTVCPQLDLTAGVGPSGEVQASWTIADPHLVLESFKVYFRHDASETWQPVAVELPQGESRTELSGQTTWWPQRHGTALEVRAEVQDRAGNANVVQRSLQLPNIAGEGPLLADASGREVDERGVDEQPPVVNRTVPPVPWPADEVIGEDGAARRRDRQTASRAPQDDRSTAGSSAGPSLPTPPRTAPMESEVADRVRAPFDLPPGETPQMTRRRRFNLEYDIEGVGPSGIANVELWATRDGGRLWERWGVDEDRRSPFPIELDEEGIYGFRIVVQSGNGLTGGLPRSGDPAEVWIGLDQTPPEAEITSARYGQGQEVGTLSIFWEATDEALHPRPITLLFSDNPKGPWTTLAAGLPNDGRYDWRVDGRVPAQIYLRLEVRDEAGNVAVHQIDRPIPNDGLIPRGRIRGIEPIEDQPREASRPWPRW